MPPLKYLTRSPHHHKSRWDWNWIITHFNSVKIVLIVTAWLKIHIDNLTTLYQNRILEVSFFVHISQCKILQLSLTFRNAWTKFHLNYSPSCLRTIWFFMSTGGPTCQRLLMMCRRCPRPSGPTYLGSIYLLLHWTLHFQMVWCMSLFWWGTFWIHCALLEVDILHIGKT